MASLRRNSFTAVDASLSIIWNLGCSPALVSCLYITVYAHTDSVSDLDFIGSAKMAFPSYSYNINTYLFPLLDVVGNLPVRSVYTFTSNFVIIAYTSFVRCGKISVGAKSSVVVLSFSLSGVGFGCVDLVFYWFVPCVPLMLRWCAYSVCASCPMSFRAMTQSFHFYCLHQCCFNGGV
jgi:hypothetical protein